MIFVMAASGGVGRLTVEALLSQGVPPEMVIAGGRNTEKMAVFADLGVKVRHADYVDGKGLVSAYQGVDTLVLIPTKTQPAPRCVEHANALTAAKAAGVKRVIFLSLQAAEPTSLFTVASFILYAESATRLSGMEWTIARMSLYTDPLADWVPALQSMGTLPYPMKDARIAYVSRADIARALAAIALRNNVNGEVVELTGPAALSMPELAAAISIASGTTIGFSSITEDEFREMCRRDHEPEEIIGFLVTLYRAAEAQEFANVSSAIELLTGRPPETVIQAVSRLRANKNAY